MTHYAALVGIDWADTKHDICLIDASTGKPEASILRHSAQTNDEWAAALRLRFNGQPIAVCLEQSRGPLIFALMKYDLLTLYPVNPSTRGLRIVKRSHPRGTKTMPVMPLTSQSYYCITVSICERGNRTRSRRAACVIWLSIGGASLMIGHESAIA